MIPKKIHYCWFGPNRLPELVKKCVATWQQHLPDYELCLWNEQNSPMEHIFVQGAYKAKKYAFVSDYVRFWALYNYGGIYLDTDMFLVQPMTNLLQNNCFFGWETADNSIVSCGVIGCETGNRFIKAILDEYELIPFDLNNKDSIIVTRLISRCYERFEHKDAISIYPYDYFYPFPYIEKENVRNFIDYRTKNTIAIHLWNISWGNPWAKLRDRVYYFLRKYPIK